MQASPRDPLVLLVEDDPAEAQRLRRLLLAGPGATWPLEHAPALAAALDRLARGDVGAVLLDLALRECAGAQAISRLRASAPSVPLVALTAASQDELGSEALAAGAQDYLVKDEIGPSLLCHAIRSAVERCRIAERSRALEQRLREIERMESLGALCGGMAFGFNTQLGRILDCCTSAIGSIDSRTRAAIGAPLLEIHRAAAHAAEMVERLRDYSALELAAPDDVDLARFVLEFSDFLETIVTPEIDVACEATPDPLWVEISRRELQRVIVSLVVNAAEAMRDRPGAVAISTGLLEADAALLAEAHGSRDAPPGPYGYLRVADTGAGLAAGRCERMFDPFYSTKFAGRGLGLSSVLGILYAHRGAVHVAPNRPTGAVFTVLLPLAADRSGRSSGGSPGGSPGGGSPGGGSRPSA